MEEEEEKNLSNEPIDEDPKNPLKLKPRYINLRISEVEKKQFEQIE